MAYPITQGYGYDPTYPLNNGQHKGIDYGYPEGTPVIVNGFTIGRSGHTGNVTGPHLHVGKWDKTGTTVYNPGSEGFSFPYPVTVYKVTYNDLVNGNWIWIRAGDFLFCYLHLSEIYVKAGQLIEEDTVTIPDADNYYWRYGQDLAMKLRGRQLSREEFSKYLVGQTDLRAIEILSDDPEAAATEHAQEVGIVAIRDNWPSQIYGLQDQVKDLGIQVVELQKRPTQQALSDLQTKYDTLEKSTQKVVDNVVIPAKPETTLTSPEPDFITKILAKFLPFLK